MPPAMPAIWPAYARIAADHALQAANDVVRSEMDDGAVRQAKLYTRARVLRRVTALVPAADIAAFRAWLAAHAHGFFAWRDPVDGRTRQARVVGGAGGVALHQAGRPGAPALWEARLTLEGEG